MSAARPGILDCVDLLLLRMAKLRRCKYGMDGEFYESYFQQDDVRKYLGDVRNAWRYAVVRTAFDQCFPRGMVRVADVGCGLGLTALFLPPAAAYTGVDSSESTLALARSLHRGADFRKGGFPCLPYDTASCDFAVCLEVVEHIEDDAAAVRELWRILRPGGHLLLSVPSTFYWPQYRSLMGHFRHYTGTSLSDLLTREGFEIERQIRQFTEFWRWYHYLYVLLRAGEATARKLGQDGFSVYQTRFYRRFARSLLAHLRQREHGEDKRSTLVLSRKPADSERT